MSAILSDCGTYRYFLERILAESGITVAFLGVNPATAEADISDQTDMKWRGFARLMGARRYIAGNPFAYRSVDVSDLARAPDPVGPDNDQYLRWIIEQADRLVPCWGSRTKLPKPLRSRLDVVRDMIFDSGKEIRIFGLTASGDPKHPLMLGYNTPLVEWKR
ncbi:DUF1643 domain-containing protein [Paraburkholderia fungorum]|uniref:DUF1643 domain-containing protein n=1 Tax=Paraburkholderia fungorum TaxID=134537 RepID=UPI001C1F1BF1|nr:DUF1643 domain-containing protein [Paraburkholderia fungorum]